MVALSPPLSEVPTERLRAMVTRYENAIFAGISTHQDLVALIEGERELLRRERERFEQRLAIEQRTRASGSSIEDGLIIT